jgi:hypothetical protein
MLHIKERGSLFSPWRLQHTPDTRGLGISEKQPFSSSCKRQMLHIYLFMEAAAYSRYPSPLHIRKSVFFIVL